jgi:hypothetical protein
MTVDASESDDWWQYRPPMVATRFATRCRDGPIAWRPDGLDDSGGIVQATILQMFAGSSPDGHRTGLKCRRPIPAFSVSVEWSVAADI